MLELAQALSKNVGVMRALPRWVLDGAIVGIVGGSDFVEEKYALMKNVGLPMVGVWMQDWSGEKTYIEGTRVIWNWQLNRSQYPSWDTMVDGWEQDGVKPFVYINPFVQNVDGDPTIRQNLFQEGVENEYFVKNQEGDPYMVNSISIKFAMVDFTNPAAYTWYKNVIKNNLVKEARAMGWMHDFGEYLPFDAVLFDGSDPVTYHNQYPADWAKCVYEAMSELENGDDVLYFMRAGNGKSPSKTRLFWMGD